MTDQAERLRQISRQNETPPEKVASGPCRVVAVSSGKGGVGKTNLVVNLALILSQWNYRVIVVDADLGMANVDVLIDAVPRYSLVDVIDGNKDLEDVMIQGPQKLKIIPGGSGFANIANLDQENRTKLLSRLKMLEDAGDFMFIDTGAGISKNVLSFVGAADDFILITSPEPTALTDAYGMIKVVSENGLQNKAEVVINYIRDFYQGQEVFNRLNKVCQRHLKGMELNYLGGIFFDPVISRAVEDCKPFVLGFPKSEASRSMYKIARRFLYQEDQEIAPKRGVNGFIDRLARLIK